MYVIGYLSSFQSLETSNGRGRVQPRELHKTYPRVWCYKSLLLEYNLHMGKSYDPTQVQVIGPEVAIYK